MSFIKKFNFIFVLVFFVNIVFAINWFEWETNILTEDENSVIAPVSWDPLKWGIEDMWQSINWIIKPYINSSEDAKYYTLTYARSLVNYFLMFLSWIALVYLLYHWFLAVSAAGNEEQYNRWIKWIKFSIVSIVWIWVTWMIISMIYWLINWTI